MRTFVENNDRAIEELLELDMGSLVRESDEMFTATIWDGDPVSIFVRPQPYPNHILLTGVEIKNEEYELCNWCGRLHLASDGKKEVNLGWLCERCIAGIQSRGEKLLFLQ